MASQGMDDGAGWTVGWRVGGLDGSCPRIWLSGQKVFPARCLSAKHFALWGGQGREEGQACSSQPPPLPTVGAASVDGHDFPEAFPEAIQPESGIAGHTARLRGLQAHSGNSPSYPSHLSLVRSGDCGLLTLTLDVWRHRVTSQLAVGAEWSQECLTGDHH